MGARRRREAWLALHRARLVLEAMRQAKRLGRLQARSDEEGCGAVVVALRLHLLTEDW
jgi:hypothetical protein